MLAAIRTICVHDANRCNPEMNILNKIKSKRTPATSLSEVPAEQSLKAPVIEEVLQVPKKEELPWPEETASRVVSVTKSSKCNSVVDVVPNVAPPARPPYRPPSLPRPSSSLVPAGRLSNTTSNINKRTPPSDLVSQYLTSEQRRDERNIFGTVVIW